MEALSVTVSAGGRPLVTSRVRSLTVIDGGRNAPPVAPAVAPRTTEATPRPDAAQRPDPGSGVGTAARAALVRANAVEGRSADGLTPAEQDLVRKLSARDAEVRRHEEAHARVGGQYAGQPSYTYQSGPDGKRYAIGGEVPIDVAPVPDDPQATIVKMDIVKRAALAPAEPSAADRRIAALADAQRLQAVADLAEQRAARQAADFDDDAAPAAVASIADLADRLTRGPESEPGQIFAVAA